MVNLDGKAANPRQHGTRGWSEVLRPQHRTARDQAHAAVLAAAAAAHRAALVRGGDGKGANAGHCIQHDFTRLEEIHQPLVLALQAGVPVHLSGTHAVQCHAGCVWKEYLWERSAGGPACGSAAVLGPTLQMCATCQPQAA